MVEINPNPSPSSGRFRIISGQKKESPKTIDKGSEHESFELTVVPGKTTAKELTCMLKQLGITDVDAKALTGANGIVDEAEITGLDETLEKNVAIRDLIRLGFKPEEAEKIFLANREKLTDADYMAAVWKLNGCGAKITPGFLESLTLEKAKNSAYIDSLLKLGDAGIKVTGTLIEALTLEKGTSSAYIELVINIVAKKYVPEDPAGQKKPASDQETQSSDLLDKLKSSILSKFKNLTDATSIANEAIDDLSMDRANNKDYVRILNENGFDFQKADEAYFFLKTGINLSVLAKRKPTAADIKKLTALLRGQGSDKIINSLAKDALRDVSLKLIGMMNAGHETISDKDRLAIIKGLSASELFDLLSFGTEEAYTSTFRLIFGAMMERMKDEGLNADTLIKKADPDFRNARLVISTCATYKKLEAFLGTIPDKKTRNALLKRFISGLAASTTKLKDATCIAELIANVEDPEIRALIQDYVLEAYNTEQDPDTKLMYCVIGGVCYAKTGSAKLEQFKEYCPVPPIDTVKRSDLVNANNEIIERLYFYDDPDGMDSYISFKNEYSSAPEWTREDRGTFIVFSKTDPVSGVKIIIYANKPVWPNPPADNPGEKAIDELFTNNKLTPPTIVVHRGHSTHVHNTIKHLPKGARIVVLGSCGGFNNIVSVVARSANASIISTKGKGTARVNEPLLRMLNESVLAQEEVSWDKFWEKASLKIAPKAPEDFPYYVAPNKNISSLVAINYRKLSRKEISATGSFDDFDIRSLMTFFENYQERHGM